MTRREWIAHLRNQIGMLEEDARAQKRLAEYQKSEADQQRKTLDYAEMLEGWAEQTRQQLIRFEQQEGK
jgi:dsDNA-binding SOS-regulon protein